MSSEDPKPGEVQELTGAPLNTFASFQNEVSVLSSSWCPIAGYQVLPNERLIGGYYPPSRIRRYMGRSRTHLSQ